MEKLEADMCLNGVSQDAGCILTKAEASSGLLRNVHEFTTNTGEDRKGEALSLRWFIRLE